MLFDPDCIEDTNLTRLVGATAADVEAKRPKVEIASRVVKGVQPDAAVCAHQNRWQDQAEHLRCVDTIFGCVDSILCRQELEVLSRRYRIPYIDVGTDVVPDGTGHRMYGQAALSMAGGPCLFCQKVLSSNALSIEGARYGSAGPRPQVVWANGVLASSAVGIALDLMTGWSGDDGVFPFLTFDGNRGTVSADPRRTYCPDTCIHYPETDLGDPKTVELRGTRSLV